MTDSSTTPPFYPSYCFDAAPTYNVSNFLRICDISTLQLYPNFSGKLRKHARLIHMLTEASPDLQVSIFTGICRYDGYG